MKTKGDGNRAGYGFGTFQGVFTPSILTIIGVVMYLRFGWMLGNVGLAASLAIVAMGSAITFLTGLSISALATNMRMKGGGAYFILSRSLGLEAGAALGIPLALSQAVSVSFYVAGFAEALVNSQLPVVSAWDMRLVGLITLAILAGISTISADIALKTQYFIMAAIALSLISFFMGGTPETISTATQASQPLGFWPVFAVFFPAVTGILSGLGMSGDLRDPGKSIPLGTLAAVLTGFAIYAAVPIALNAMVPDPATLRADTMILQRCARWPSLVLVGIWAATLSSAIGSFLVAPRVFQALSRDRLLPQFLGRGFGRADDPRFASAFAFAIAALGVWFGNINELAPVLTLFNLSTYGLLNFCAAMEEAMSNPTWRPTFRVKAAFPFLGFAGCLAAMLMISPGWTFVALICEGAIFWGIKRRNLRAQWGDMRTGLYAGLVRFALRGLMRDRHAERNWRPNLMVLSRLPIQNIHLFELARGVSGGGSLVTLASVLPEGFVGSPREADLRDSILRTAERLSLEAEVKFLDAKDEWTGLSELIRAYGFGPIAPNTIVLGFPQPEHFTQFAGIVKLATLNKKNVLIVGGFSSLQKQSPPEPANTNAAQQPASPVQGPSTEQSAKTNCQFIDVWWRGGGGNGSLMLALALLLGRGGMGEGEQTLRMNMIVQKRPVEEAKAELEHFLMDSRVDATRRVFNAEGRPFGEIICDNSQDASITLVGLRRPEESENDVDYGAYFAALAEGISTIPYPIFVLAAEDVDFRRIFA